MRPNSHVLNVQLCAEGPDNEIYCNLCYAYKHGHKAKPNLNVADVTAIQGEEGEANVCPRFENPELSFYVSLGMINCNHIEDLECFNLLRCFGLQPYWL